GPPARRGEVTVTALDGAGAAGAAPLLARGGGGVRIDEGGQLTREGTMDWRVTERCRILTCNHPDFHIDTKTGEVTGQCRHLAYVEWNFTFWADDPAVASPRKSGFWRHHGVAPDVPIPTRREGYSGLKATETGEVKLVPTSL